jgi:hypothetical protein
MGTPFLSVSQSGIPLSISETGGTVSGAAPLGTRATGQPVLPALTLRLYQAAPLCAPPLEKGAPALVRNLREVGAEAPLAVSTRHPPQTGVVLGPRAWMPCTARVEKAALFKSHSIWTSCQETPGAWPVQRRRPAGEPLEWRPRRPGIDL